MTTRVLVPVLNGQRTSQRYLWWNVIMHSLLETKNSISVQNRQRNTKYWQKNSKWIFLLVNRQKNAKCLSVNQFSCWYANFFVGTTSTGKFKVNRQENFRPSGLELYLTDRKLRITDRKMWISSVFISSNEHYSQQKEIIFLKSMKQCQI